MRVHAQWGGRVLRGHLANGYDTTGPGQSLAQDVFFSDVWWDRLRAGLMHWSTR